MGDDIVAVVLLGRPGTINHALRTTKPIRDHGNTNIQSAPNNVQVFRFRLDKESLLMSQNKIYVGNIAFTVSEDDLKETFSQYGAIEDIKLVIDRATGRSRGFGFITFEKQFDAEASLALNDTDVGGRKISVSMAKEREKRPTRKFRR